MNFPYSIFKTTSGYHSIAFLIAFFVGSPYPDKITSIFFCVSFFSLHGSIYNIFPTALTRYHVSSRYTKPLIRNVSTKSIFRKWESVSNFISSWMCRRYFRKVTSAVCNSCSVAQWCNRLYIQRLDGYIWILDCKDK